MAEATGPFLLKAVLDCIQAGQSLIKELEHNLGFDCPEGSHPIRRRPSDGTIKTCVCDAGLKDCSASGAMQPLCVDLKSNEAHCGSCSNRCDILTQTCANGKCINDCSADTPDICGNSCVNKLNDESNCGTCGNVCQEGGSCESGVCRCQPGQTSCGSSPGKCADTQTDRQNCGSGGNVYGNDEICEGSCVKCPSNQLQCNNQCINNDVKNCGACGKACPVPIGGSATCNNGICGQICPNGNFPYTCNNSCTPPTDNNNCGDCGKVCKAGEHCGPNPSGGVFCNACPDGYNPQFCSLTGINQCVPNGLCIYPDLANPNACTEYDCSP